MPPALKALSLQAMSGVLGVASLWALAALRPGMSMSWVTFALLQGTLAALMSVALRQARWWWLIHFSFAPALVLALKLPVSPHWYLAGFALLALCYWNSARGQVPLYLSNRLTAQAVGTLAHAEGARCLIDAGCGTGSLLLAVARAQPALTCVGLENAPLPWALARLRALGRANYRVYCANFWSHSLAEAQVVYAFLSPVPMARLWQKLCAELPPGALLVSNTFEVPGLTAERVIEVADRRRTRLYCYRIPAAA